MFWKRRVLTFTVHEPPGSPSDRFDRAESLVFVKDGFSLIAALWAPLWLLGNKLWLAFAGYVMLAAAVAGAGWAMGLGEQLIGYILAALNLIVAFEGDVIHRWTLEQQGWRMVGSVSGNTLEECERRFFDAWLPGQPYVHATGLQQSKLGAGAEPAPIVSERPATAAGGWRSGFALGRRN